MIYLNLISLAKKNELKRKMFFDEINALIIYTILILVFSLFSLWGTNYLVQEEDNQVTKQIENAKNMAGQNNGTGPEEKNNLLNNRLKELYTKQINYQKWSVFIEELSKTTPSGIYLNYLSLDKDTKSVELRGRAAYRDDLLNYKNNLESNKSYSNINIPITNFLQKTDIDFQISFNFNSLKSSNEN